MQSINPENPVFVLAFCIFKTSDYSSVVKEAITKLKLQFWGHDLPILHSHSIRRSKGEFSFLFNEEVRHIFLHSLHETIKNLPFSIIATAIDKRLYKNKSENPLNPYVVALNFCLDFTLRFLKDQNQLNQFTHIIVESRGKVEDRELESAFTEFLDNKFPLDLQCPFAIKFASKKTNSCGLQLADLVAHPIAKYVSNKKTNRAFEIVRQKLLGYPDFEEVGLKLYPLENEMPQFKLRQNADRELPIHITKS